MRDFLKKLGSFAKNYKYWIALSYNMPTQEILSFFGKIHEGKLKEERQLLGECLVIMLFWLGFSYLSWRQF